MRRRVGRLRRLDLRRHRRRLRDPRGSRRAAIALALEKVAHENTVREELAAGEFLRTVFARHGIL